MNVSRRQFLTTGGTAAAVVAATGCKRVPAQLESLLGAEPGAFQPPTADAIDPVAHVLNRLSFGPRPGDYAKVRALAKDSRLAAELWIEEQLNPERIEDSACTKAMRRFDSLDQPLGEFYEYKEQVLIREMVRSTVLRAISTERQLFEMMVHFWTDHFNIDPSKGDCQWLKAWDDREVIRRHALGGTPKDEMKLVQKIWYGVMGGPEKPAPREVKFPDLLRASALSPAMLWYLDGRQNRKENATDKPNENYARELLELHTLGVHGGYTQKDVMEVARCLTGWTVRGRNKMFKGQVEFKKHLHDDGAKEVLGHHIPAGLGAKDLDRVLEIVSLHPSTAKYLAGKLCRWFISDAPSAPTVSSVAEEFLKTGGDIRATLRAVFRSDEFWSARGVKFKRPFHFVVSAVRATEAKTDARGPLIDYLERMGHLPFHYPTPDGYPQEPEPWMGTLLWRWNFALALHEGRLDGTRVNEQQLVERAGGVEGFMAHLLGRKPTPAEVESYRNSGAGLALMLAAPAFQRC
ncbi:MAG: DUF1800 domain-containing protein [Verrucomicrobiota bacterium]